MRIVSWNVNSIRARHDHVLRFLDEQSPDVLCLQETKVVDGDFPADELRAAGYEHLLFDGQKSYNGVAIISKHPIEDPQKGFSEGGPDKQKRLVAGTVNGIRIFDCYVPMGTSPTSEKFKYKLQWLARMRAELNKLSPSDEVVMCGDLNVSRGELDVWDPFGCDGKILYHPHERMVLERVMGWGLKDSFRELYPEEKQFSWWDYRAGAFWKNHGFRIDYVLVSAPLLERCTSVTLHRDCRKWKPTPSDHIPVDAAFE